METNKRGGARSGSGRSKLPKEDKKIPITVWVPLKIVNKHGGKKGAKKLCLNALAA